MSPSESSDTNVASPTACAHHLPWSVVAADRSGRPTAACLSGSRSCQKVANHGRREIREIGEDTDLRRQPASLTSSASWQHLSLTHVLTTSM